MGHGPDTRRRHVNLVRVDFGIGDELRNCSPRKRWIDNHDKGRASHESDRRDVADEVKIEIRVKRRIDCIRCRGRQQRVTVGGRIHDSLGGYRAAGPRTILNDELLAEPL